MRPWISCSIVAKTSTCTKSKRQSNQMPPAKPIVSAIVAPSKGMFNDFIIFCPTKPYLSNHHQERRMPFYQIHNCFLELGFHCRLQFHIRIFMILKGIDAKSKWVSEEYSLMSLHLYASINSIFDSSFPEQSCRVFDYCHCILRCFNENSPIDLQFYKLEELHSIEVAHHHALYRSVLENRPHCDHRLGPLFLYL